MMQKKPFPYLLVAALTMLIALTTFVSFDEGRQWIRDLFQNHSRTVLAKVDGDLTGKGDLVSVVKIRTARELSIEVYEMVGTERGTPLRARLILPEKRDGSFLLKGQMTNLALVDINNDGLLEILVPTFDENLIPRLHIYKYDPTAQVFTQMAPAADFVPDSNQ